MKKDPLRRPQSDLLRHGDLAYRVAAGTVRTEAVAKLTQLTPHPLSARSIRAFRQQWGPYAVLFRFDNNPVPRDFLSTHRLVDQSVAEQVVWTSLTTGATAEETRLALAREQIRVSEKLAANCLSEAWAAYLSACDASFGTNFAAAHSRNEPAIFQNPWDDGLPWDLSHFLGGPNIESSIFPNDDFGMPGVREHLILHEFIAGVGVPVVERPAEREEEAALAWWYELCCHLLRLVLGGKEICHRSNADVLNLGATCQYLDMVEWCLHNRILRSGRSGYERWVREWCGNIPPTRDSPAPWPDDRRIVQRNSHFPWIWDNADNMLNYK